MDEFPVSRATLKRAYTLGTCAKKMGMDPAIGILDQSNYGDTMIYMFASKSDIAIIYCCPNCYLVTYGNKAVAEKDANYLIVANIKTFLSTLKKMGFEALSKKELEELQKRVRKQAEEMENEDE